MATTFLRWRFEDPFDPYLSNTYTFALNPNAMTSPFPRRNITARGTTAINGRTLLTEGQRQPTEWTFSGDFLDPNHYEALRSWVLDRMGRRLYLYDHFGRKMTVVPLQFDPTPKRVIARYWRHTYTITCLVLDVEGPTFRVDEPMVPRQVKVSGKYERATVTWQPPASARGSAILYYTIYSDTGDSHRVYAGEPLVDYWSGIPAGNHTFRVSATSTAGESGAMSASAYISPIVGPFGIKITSATASYDTATIRWSPPADNGGSEVTGYIVTARQQSSSTFGNGTWSLPADARSYTFKNLASYANTYELTVAGVNARATGPAASKTIKTLMAEGPSAPVITKVVATAFSIRVEWEAPVRDGGFPLRDYSVVLESFVGGDNGDVYLQGLPVTNRAYTLTRLRPGVLYRVSVYASNTKSLGSAGKSGVNIKTITTLKG